MSYGDSHINRVRLLLPCSGEAGSTEIIDRAPVPGYVTCSGTAALTMTNARDGRAALAFPGLSSSFAVVSPVGQNLSFASGDFTIECWLRAGSVDTQRTVLDFRPARDSNAPWLWLNAGGGLVLQDHYQSTARITTANGTVAVNTWYHVAISRADGVVRLFVDGTLRGEFRAFVMDYGYQGAVYLGRNVYSYLPQPFYGLLQDIRVTIGVGRYVGNFTPPVSLPTIAPPPAWLSLPSPLVPRTGLGAAAWLNSAGAAWIDAEGIGYPLMTGISAPALRAAPIGHSDYSEIASGPFGAAAPTLDFAYRVLSQAGADVLTITARRADTGAVVATLATASGLGAWTRIAFDPATLPAGPESAPYRYRLHFRYTKDDSISVGADTAYLAPLAGFPLPGAWCALPGPLGAPTLVAVSPASTLSAKLALPGPLGVPAFVASPPGRACLALDGPLGVPRFVASPPAAAWCALPGPLGVPGWLAAVVPLAWADLPGPLGAPAMRARQINIIAPPVAPADLLAGGAGARLLTDPLPLRRTVELPMYREDVYLPWVFGRATVRAVSLDEARVEWLVADHPIVGVDWVSVGGAETDGWQLVQRVDDAGHPIALIRLTQPAKANEVVAVRVVGRRHPVTGAVLAHPARIAAELLSLCGWAPPADAFARLIDDLPGLEVGAVYDGNISLREALAKLLEPLGAWWSAGTLSTPQARIDAPGEPVFTLTVANCDSISARVDHSQIATIGRVTFDYDWAAGVARQALTVDALAAIDRYGRIEADFAMPHIHTARDALERASARLAARARAAWSIDATIPDRGDLPAPGDTVRIDHPHVPAGLAVVRSRQRGRGDLSATLKLELRAGAEPAVSLARRGRLIDAASDAMAVTFKDGWATFKITDDNGNALAGASVTLDGEATRNTDARGQVQFKTTRGTHTLTVAADGYMTFTMEVAV